MSKNHPGHGVPFFGSSGPVRVLGSGALARGEQGSLLIMMGWGGGCTVGVPTQTIPGPHEGRVALTGEQEEGPLLAGTPVLQCWLGIPGP